MWRPTKIVVLNDQGKSQSAGNQHDFDKMVASDRASILQVIEGNKIGWFVYEQHQFKPIK